MDEIGYYVLQLRDNPYEYWPFGTHPEFFYDSLRAHLTAAMVNKRRKAQGKPLLEVVKMTDERALELYEETVRGPKGYTIYSQRDPDWKDTRLGTGNTTIGRYGCLITCVAMLVTHARDEEVTPLDVNERLKEVGGFGGENGNLMIPGKEVVAYPELGTLELHNYPYPKSADMSVIDDALEGGDYVIIQVDFDPGDTDLDSHFVVVESKIDYAHYSILDPWEGKRFELPPAYCKPGWAARHAIFQTKVYRLAQG